MRWLLLFTGFSVFAQVEYEFDYVVVYDEYFAECKCNKPLGTISYSFVNSKDNGYSLRATQSDGTYFLAFNDERNKIQGSGGIDKSIFSKTSTIVLSNWVQYDRRGPRPLEIKQYFIDSTILDSSRTEYVLTRKSKKKIKKEGLLRRVYIVNRELSKKYNELGFNTLKNIFYSKKNKSVKHGILEEHYVDSIDNSKILRWRLDTIYPLKRKLILNKKPYYTPKIKG